MISFTKKQLITLIRIIMDSKEYSKEKQQLLDLLVYEKMRLDRE